MQVSRIIKQNLFIDSKIYSDHSPTMKDDVKDVNTGFECGVGCDKFSNWNEGDIIEAFKLVTKKRSLSK